MTPDQLAIAIRLAERVVARLSKSKRDSWAMLSAYIHAYQRLGALRLESWKFHKEV